MHKTTFVLGLGLALSLGAAELAAQQAPVRPDSAKAGARAGDRGARSERARGQRGPGARQQGRGMARPQALLRGITLTDAQQAQVRTIHEQQRASMQANTESRRQALEQLRAARQRGDTAAVRALSERQRAEMTQRRDRQLAAVRAILTPEQQVQFDRNVAELKARAEQRPAGAREGRGPRQWRGARGA